MKYLSILLLMSSCTTVPCKPHPIDDCLESLEQKIEQVEGRSIPEEQRLSYRQTLFLFCSLSDNDPDVALKNIDAMRYSH